MRNLGVIDHGILYALPVGNIAPSGMAGIFGWNDPVNGFFLGKLLNPSATMTSVAGRFLGMGHLAKDYFALFPPNP